MLCGRCNLNERRPGQSYCPDCHADYIRIWRLLNPLTVIERYKQSSRSQARYSVKKGRIVKRPCEICDDTLSQMHHEDYGKPLKVIWLCEPCHRGLHQAQRAQERDQLAAMARKWSSRLRLAANAAQS